jgi:hypothetical protein
MKSNRKYTALALGAFVFIVTTQVASAFYDPNPGRWINRDPIQESGGVNLYGYVGNNPIDRRDPFGLELGYCYMADGRMLPPGEPEHLGNAMESWTVTAGCYSAVYCGRVAAPAAMAGFKWVAVRCTIDGPCGTRIVQIRWMKVPVFRLDYGPIPESGGSPVLHCHVKWVNNCKSHIPIWPPGTPR